MENAHDKASALTEKNGVSQPETVSRDMARNVVSRRQRQPSAQELVDGIFRGDITSLSRAITLVESTNAEHQQKAADVVSACLPRANNSVRIGITGVPGVGKSTF